MAAKKSKVSQIRKDVDKFLVDAERSIEKHARDALKGLRKSVQALAKQAEQLEKKIEGVEVDKRFVYYLLASEGICVVPLTGFCCNRKGFRVTLLEVDDAKRRNTWDRIATVTKEYLHS